METYYLIMGAIVLFGVSLMVGICGGIIYLIYLPIKNQLLKKGKLTLARSRQINKIYILALLLFSIYKTYDAFFPSESFYKDEFENVTLREIPESAQFIFKKSSYPDFHGDYASSSQIKLSKEDYKKLLNELSSDSQFSKDGQIIGFEEFDYTLNNKDQNNILVSFTRPIKGEEDCYLYIGFYNDNQTIFVNKSIT
jgi:hypothetical protein